MSTGYTGLHGRSPYEVAKPHRHFSPEGWEDLDRAICPGCGRTVSWNADRQVWVKAPELRVLVLTPDEVAGIRETCPESVEFPMDIQLELQEEVRE